MNKNFWKNKKVFVTGHTGFKGSWLVLMLNQLGAKVYGYALNPISKPNFFDNANLTQFLEKDHRKDILKSEYLLKTVKSVKPSIIFHLAAQSSVLVSYKNPRSTLETNLNGTFNILETAKKVKSVKSLIIVTTDKVYKNLEQKISFSEESQLGGHDLYSSSKAVCELIVESYKKSFLHDSHCNVATVRSGNCIGGGDWTKDRIVKDCVEAFIKNKKLIIRNPSATRPWQHVIEPLFGYLILAEKLYLDKNKKFSTSWNFGPKSKNLTVSQLSKIGKKIMNSNSKIYLNRKKSNNYEATFLSLNSNKARRLLGWKTILSSKLALNMTFEWFEYFYSLKSKEKIIDFSYRQINNYIEKLKKNK